MKLSLVVQNALNGDASTVDPAVRRTLIAIANEHDEQAGQWDSAIEGLEDKIDLAVYEMKEEVKGVRKLLLTLTTTVIGGVIIGIINVVVNVNL